MDIKQFTFNPIEVNTYLLYDETKECIIIDPGCFSSGEGQELISFIADNQLKPVGVLNTHLHFDHCFGTQFVFDTYGIQPRANALDRPLLERATQQLEMFGFKNRSIFTDYKLDITDGDLITFGNTTLKAIHIPGHSLGSIVYYNEKEDILITGDVLFRESVGRADLPGGDYFTLIEGIEQKLMTLPPHTVVYPGHGPSTTIQHEQNNNPYLQ